MLYNKSQLNKTSDKKLMRKVKSKWVVVSTAAFAAGGFALASQGADAHADTVNNASQSQTTQQSTTNSTTQTTQQNTAPTLASNDLTQGQVTGTANAGNTMATAQQGDASDAASNSQSVSYTAGPAPVTYDGFTNSRAKDVDPMHYNANDTNTSTGAYQKGVRDYNEYRYGVVGGVQYSVNGAPVSQNSWGTLRNVAMQAANQYTSDYQKGTVQSDAQIQSTASRYVQGGTDDATDYTNKLYTAAYLDTEHIHQNETAKGEYMARNGMNRPDDSNVTNLASSFSPSNTDTNSVQDQQATYNAYKQALTNTDPSKDYIGISSQTYDVYMLAAQQAEAGITDTSKLDSAYNNLQQSYNFKYKGIGMLNGMPVSINTQPQTRSQNPVWADGTQYGLGVNAGIADAKAKKAMTLGSDINYNAGYTTAFNNYSKGLSDAANDLSFNTTLTPTSNTPWASTQQISYPAGYAAGYKDGYTSYFNDYKQGISYVLNHVNTQLFATGLTATDYQGKSQAWQQGADGAIYYWNQEARGNMQIPVMPTHVIQPSNYNNWAQAMELVGFSTMLYANQIDSTISNVNAIINNAAGLYTATDGKSLTLTTSPNSAINANALKVFDVFMQTKASGYVPASLYNNGLLNQAYSRLADNLTQYAMNDDLLSGLSQGDTGIQQALSGNVATGSPSDALNAAYEYNVAKGYQDASQGVAYSSHTATSGSYTLGYNAYKDIKISVDNYFGANEQPYNGDTDTYSTINQAVSTTLSGMFPAANRGNLSYEVYLPNPNSSYTGGDLSKFLPAYVSSLKSMGTSTLMSSSYNNALNASLSPYVNATSAATNITNMVLNALTKGSGSGIGDEVGITLNNAGNNLVQYGSNGAPYNGYSQDMATAALMALVAGANGNSFTPDSANINLYDSTTNTIYTALKTAYQLGQQVGRGANDAINGKRYTSSDNVSDAQYNANLGALQALAELNNDIQQNHSLPFPNNGISFLDAFVLNGGPGSGNPLGSSSSNYSPSLRKSDALPATSYGYQLLYTAIGNNMTAGAYQFAFNVARPTQVGMNYVYDLSKQAFDNAKTGLNVYGTSDSVNSWDAAYALQSIVSQAWSDVQAGIAYVDANAKVPTDGSIAYQMGAQAYYDASTGANPRSTGSLYMDIYNQYTNVNEVSPYPEGAKSFAQPGVSTSGSVFTNYRFQKGHDDAQAAYKLAMQATATMPSTFTPIQQAVFQAVRDAIHNNFASQNDKASTGKYQGVGNGEQNDVYQAFYSYAQANLKSTNDLIAQFQNSDDSDSDVTDLHAYFNVYQNYMNGFNAGETNAANPNANDTFINAGYNDGVKVYNAVQDYLQSPVGNDQLTEAAADAMFDVSNQASAPHTYSSRLQREAYRLTFNALSPVAQKVVSDFQNPTGAVSYVGADAKSQVSRMVYVSLQDAFNGVDQGNFTPSGPYAAEGIQAYQKLLSVAQSSIDHPSSSSASVGNHLVWQAVQDALNGAHRDNQGLAYDTFYNMAKKIKDNQDAQAKAQADAAQADADRDAASKRADQSDANAKQAEADKAAAQQAQSQAETDKANAQKAQADAEAKAQQADADKQQADAQRDAAIKAQQQSEADKAQADSDRDNAIKAQQQADADRDAANKRADQSDANAKQADADKQQAEQDKANALAQAAQAEADKAKAEQAQAQAQAAQADAEAKRDAAIKAQQQAEADRDAAIKAQQAAQAQSQTDGADKAQAEQDKADAIEAQQRAENARDAAIKAQHDAEAQRDDAVKAQQQAEADKSAALQAQKAAEDKAAQATDAMNKADAERDAANAANQQAQADKATAQKAQADAEATAKQAEQDKANAQTAMQQAIADRDKAVSDRDTAIKQMNDAIADANQKVADAQKADLDAEAQVKVAQAAQVDAQRRADEATAEAATAKKIADDAVIGKQDADARAQKATDDMNKAIADRNASQAETQKATDAMNDAIKAKNDALAQAQQANSDKQAAINKANADIADANQRIADAIQAQADAQAKAQQAQKDADAASAKASQDVADANAKAQAEIDKAKSQAQSDIDKAKSEAQAEVAKAQSDNTKSDAVRKADEARELREAEHQQKVNYKHGYELAYADARNGRMKPATFLTREDQFFVRGYEQGFMAYMNKHMPKYVSNKADIHIYDGDTFTTKNRGKLVDTKHAKNFRVYGVTFNKFGHIRYNIGNGKFITANRKFMVSTYFAPTNKAKHIKVRLGRTILVHKNKGFSDRKHLRVLHSGDIIQVRRVIKFHGITRLVVKGGYITSNRLFVKLAK